MKTQFKSFQKTAIVIILMMAQLFASINVEAQVLYGLTSSGGADNYGAVIKYDNTGSILTVLASFTSVNSGAYPNGLFPSGSFIQASNGKLYAPIKEGGAHDNGTVVEFDITANTLTKKADFESGTTGLFPYGSFIQATNGKLYAMTSFGGATNSGVVVEYDIAANTLTKKADFEKVTTGALPRGSFIQATNGKLYGMTSYGGASNNGTVVEYDITANTLTKLSDFTEAITGAYPWGSFIQASNGKLYAMASGREPYSGVASDGGTVVEYDITAHTLTKKADFSRVITGSAPYGSFIQASNGKLYALASEGGVNSDGTVVAYDITTNTLTKKADFVKVTTGSRPYGSFIQASNGKLYGWTNYGGTNDLGVVVEYDITANTLTKKNDFTEANGANPFLGNFIELAQVPTVTTTAATSITTTGATLNGAVKDNGALTTVTFDYGTDPTLAGSTNVAATTGGTVTAGAGITNASVSISGLLSNTTYYFRVKAINSAGTSLGTILSFKTLTADTDGDGVPDVYDCEPLDKKNDKWLICHKGQTLCVAQSAVDAHIKHGDYLGSCTTAPQVSKAIISQPEVVTSKVQFGVYPSPSNGQFTVQLSNSKPTKVEVLILNKNGSVVERRVVNALDKQLLTFDLGKQAAGIYIVKVFSEDGVKTNKVIIQK